MATIDNYTIDIKVNGDKQIKNATADADNLGKSVNTLHSNDLKQLGDRLTDTSGKLEFLSSKFEMVKSVSEQFITTLAGFGAIGLVTYMLQGADATDKLAKAFGLSLESALELQGAFAKIGVDTDGVARTFTTLAEKVEALKRGDAGAIDAFNELGISFKDLQNMNMKETILAIADALTKARGSTEAITAARDLLGKAFVGKDPEEFADTLRKMIGTQEKAAETTRNLAATQENLEYAYKKVKLAFIELFEPASRLMKEFTDNGINAEIVARSLAGAMLIIGGSAVIKGITTVIEAIKGLAAWFGITSTAATVATATTSGYVATQAASAAQSIIQAAGLARVATATMAVNVAQLQLNVLQAQGGAAAAGLTAAETALATANARLATMTEAAALTQAQLTASMTATTVATTAAGAASVTAGSRFGALLLSFGKITAIAAVVVAAIEGINYVMEKVFGKGPIDYFAEKLEKIVKEYLPTMHSYLEKIGKYLGMAPGKLAPQEAAAVSAKPAKDSDLDKPLVEKTARKVDLNAASLLAMRQQLETLKEQNEITEERILMQAKLVGLSNEQKYVVEQTFNIESKRAMDILALNQQIAVKQKEAANTLSGEGQKKIGEEIKILQERLKYIKEYTVDTVYLGRVLEEIKQKEAANVAWVQIKNKLSDERLRTEGELAKLTMTADQQRISSLKEQMDLAVKSEIQRREAMLGRGGVVDFQQQLHIMDVMKEKYQPLIDATQKLIDKSREFATGWKQAFNQAMDDATNSAKIARDSFNVLYNSMNSAIDNFVMTGKFKFKDFAASIIQDLLKIELKASAMKLFGAASGGGGGFLETAWNFGKSLLGFAEGGEPPVGRPSIVGEKGPEIFIPRSSGTIIPNSALGAMGGQSSVTNTYVTNNISAIDAKSVAQLFTDNRRILLGSVRTAEKELPYRGR